MIDMGFRKIDKHSGIPAYLQIMNMVKKEILLGNLKIGDQLPPVRELQRIFDVNVNTVMKALERLVFEGVIEAKHGVGYFVKESNEVKSDAVRLLKETVKSLKNMGLDLHTVLLLTEEVWKSERVDE